jgi:hypothetical protein
MIRGLSGAFRTIEVQLDDRNFFERQTEPGKLDMPRAGIRNAHVAVGISTHLPLCVNCSAVQAVSR